MIKPKGSGIPAGKGLMSSSGGVVLVGLVVIAAVMTSLVTLGDRGFPWDPVKEATISGTVTCASGEPVVGVYIAQITKVGLFASWEADAQRLATATYRADVPVGVAYEVHVGCGGTPDDWLLNAKSGNSDELVRTLICEDRKSRPGYGVCT